MGAAGAESFLIPGQYSNGDTPPIRLGGGRYQITAPPMRSDMQCKARLTLKRYGASEVIKEGVLGMGLSFIRWEGVPVGVYLFSVTPINGDCTYMITFRQ